MEAALQMSTWMVSSLPTSLKVIKVLIKKHYYCGILQFLTFQVALRWLKENRPNWPEDHWTSSRAENPNRCQTRLQTPTWETLQRLPFYTAELSPNQICELADKAPPTAVEKHYFQQVTFPKPAPFQTPFRRNKIITFCLQLEVI